MISCLLILLLKTTVGTNKTNNNNQKPKDAGQCNGVPRGAEQIMYYSSLYLEHHSLFDAL